MSDRLSNTFADLKAAKRKAKKAAQADDKKKNTRNATLTIIDRDGTPTEYEYAMREAAGDDHGDQAA